MYWDPWPRVRAPQRLIEAEQAPRSVEARGYLSLDGSWPVSPNATQGQEGTDKDEVHAKDRESSGLGNGRWRRTRRDRLQRSTGDEYPKARWKKLSGIGTRWEDLKRGCWCGEGKARARERLRQGEDDTRMRRKVVELHVPSIDGDGRPKERSIAKDLKNASRRVVTAGKLGAARCRHIGRNEKRRYRVGCQIERKRTVGFTSIEEAHANEVERRYDIRSR